MPLFQLVGLLSLKVAVSCFEQAIVVCFYDVALSIPFSNKFFFTCVSLLEHNEIAAKTSSIPEVAMDGNNEEVDDRYICC